MRCLTDQLQSAPVSSPRTSASAGPFQICYRSPSPRYSLHTRKGGFTIIEALAAFLTLAIVMGSLLTGVRQASENDQRAEFLLIASRTVQNIIATAGVTGPIQVGTVRGSISEGLEFEQTTTVYRDASEANPRDRIYLISVVVSLKRTSGMSPLKYAASSLRRSSFEVPR